MDKKYILDTNDADFEIFKSLKSVVIDVADYINAFQFSIPELNPFYGCKHDEETKKHISYMQSTKVGKLNQFFGKKHKPETIENNRLKNIQIHTERCGKKVLQYTLDGNLVAEYNSIRAAARVLGQKHPQILGCCSGKYNTAYGYNWKYA